MEIFNETKNRYMLTILQLINHLYNCGANIAEIDESIALYEKTMAKAQDAKSAEGCQRKIEQLQREKQALRVNEAQFDELFYLYSEDKEKRQKSFLEERLKASPENGGYRIFDFTDPDNIQLYTNAPVEIMPCAAEKAWLRLMLEDERAAMLFGDDMKQRILSSLSDFPALSVPAEISRSRMGSELIDDDFCAKLRLILQAIHEHREIVYSNHTRYHGDFVNMRAVPLKVEYSIVDDRLRAVMRSSDNRPIKANISNMYDISLGEMADRSTAAENVKRRLKRVPLCFTVTNNRNALERAILTFTKYKRNITKIDDTTYSFEIFYYTFEAQKLISDIIAFGPNLQVISPSHIRREIAERIKRFGKLDANADNKSTGGFPMFEWAKIDLIGSLDFEQVLIEYGIPELIICRDEADCPYLVWLINDKFDYYIVKLTTAELLKLLLGKITVNTALFSLHEQAVLYNGIDRSAKHVTPADISEDVKYEDDFCLEYNNEAYIDGIMKECMG